MKALIIRGTDKYIDYLNKHLGEEHPETRKLKTVKKINENILKTSDDELNEIIGLE